MENISPVARSDTALRSDTAPRFLQWSPIILGAFAATALSSVLLTFGVTVGLGVTSTAPTWRDASAALAILSGIYLIIQAVLSFGLGGYIAGHGRLSASAATPGGDRACRRRAWPGRLGARGRDGRGPRHSDRCSHDQPDSVDAQFCPGQRGGAAVEL